MKTQSPQLEEGYTRIANKILEKLSSYRISGEEWMILLTILRKTYGFNKKEDLISLSQFFEATGLAKQSICRAINKLIKKNVINKKATGNSYLYSFNKLFNTWLPLTKKRQINNAVNTINKKATFSSAIKRPQNKKENNTKDNNIKNKEALIFIKHFNACFNREYRLTKNRIDKFNIRRKTFSLQDILSSTTRLSQSPFHRGNNDRKWEADPDFLLRNDEQIDKWLVKSKPLQVRQGLADLIKKYEKPL